MLERVEFNSFTRHQVIFCTQGFWPGYCILIFAHAKIIIMSCRIHAAKASIGAIVFLIIKFVCL
jgi:hypothetical protein